MRILIISIFLLLVLAVTPKYAYTDRFDEGKFRHIEVADLFYAPWFKDTGVFGVFGGYLGGDRGGQIIDWSIGNTIPHSSTITDDIVFSTSVGSFDNPANWFERMRITKEGNVGIGTTSPQSKLDVTGNIDAGRFDFTYPAPNTLGTFAVNFNKTFATTPNVVISLHSLQQGEAFALYTSGLTTTGFSFQFKTGIPGNGAIQWIAIQP